MQATDEHLDSRLGICQWFHYQDHGAVERAVELMRELGCRHLRTGVSWADYCRPGGAEWYDWQMKQLREAGLEVLLSVWHTPPSLSEDGACNGPPRRLRDYADFIDTLINRYGDAFSHLELWNEPNNRLKWNFPAHDPAWAKFAEMIGAAAYWAKQRGRSTVLGGMIPVDHTWLRAMERYGVLRYIDAVGVHAFPGMWWPDRPNWEWMRDWKGWDAKLAYIAAHAGERPIWVTETGFAAYHFGWRAPGLHDVQCEKLREAAAAPADRVYWYCLMDLDPAREAIEGFHVDENEYHLGLVTHGGTRKDAFELFRDLLRGGRRLATDGVRMGTDEGALGNAD